MLVHGICVTVSRIRRAEESTLGILQQKPAGRLAGLAKSISKFRIEISWSSTHTDDMWFEVY